MMLLVSKIPPPPSPGSPDRKSTRLNSSHSQISYAVFCLKKKKKKQISTTCGKSRTTLPLSSQYREDKSDTSSQQPHCHVYPHTTTTQCSDAPTAMATTRH